MCGACEDMLMMLFCLHQGKNWKPQNQNWIQPKSWSIQMLRIQLRSVLKLWKKLNSLKHKVKHTSVSRTAARKRNTAALDPDLSWSLQRFQISAVFLKLCFVEWSSVTGNNLNCILKHFSSCLTSLSVAALSRCVFSAQVNSSGVASTAPYARECCRSLSRGGVWQPARCFVETLRLSVKRGSGRKSLHSQIWVLRILSFLADQRVL